MKKLTVFVCVLLAVLFVLSSCGTEFDFDKMKSERVLQKINDKMERLDSYEYDIEMQMTFEVMGQKVVGTATGHGIEAGVDSDDYYRYESMESKTVCEKLKLNETSKSMLVYSDGKTFLLNESDDHSQRICAPMTVSEFREYQEEKSSLPDLDEEYSRIQSAKNDDKTWTVTCSGFSDQVIDSFRTMSGLDEDQLGAKLTDMEVVFSADTKYRITRIDLRCIFEKVKDETESENASETEDTSALPELTMSVCFSKYNEAERLTDQLNPEDYTEVDDIRILDRVEDTIRTYREAEEGSFKVEMSQSLYRLWDLISEYRETDRVHFGNNDDGYFYSVNAKVKGVWYQIDYANGTQTVTSNEKTNETSQTEEEARKLIDDLLDSLHYDANYVNNVTRTEDGDYLLQIDSIPSSVYRSIFGKMGASYKGGSQTITVHVEDGKIISLSSVVKANGMIYGYSLSLTINCTLTFQ